MLDARSTRPKICPQITQMTQMATCPSVFLTQRRRGAETQRVSLAVSEPGEVLAVNDGQEPLDGDTTAKSSFRRGAPAQRPALEKRRPRPTLSSIARWKRTVLRHKTERGRRNRHACGVAAGGATGLDERSRSERPGTPPVAGDPRIAGCSAGESRLNASSSATNTLRLCAFALYRAGGRDLRHLRDLRANLGWAGALRLCASATLRFLLPCFP